MSNYDEIKFNPNGDLFPIIRKLIVEKVGNDTIDVLVDSHEPQENAKELEKRGFNVEIRQLEIGDYVFEGGIAFERKKNDFFNADDVIQKSMELKKAFKHPYLIVEGDLKNLLYVNAMYSKIPIGANVTQINGLVASLCVRGMPPIFTTNRSNMFNIMTRIVEKHLDGKDRENDRKIAGFRVVTNTDITTALYMNLPGVSYSIAEALKIKYPTMKDLMEATPEDLMKIKQIGEKRAYGIFESLRGSYK